MKINRMQVQIAAIVFTAAFLIGSSGCATSGVSQEEQIRYRQEASTASDSMDCSLWGDDPRDPFIAFEMNPDIQGCRTVATGSDQSSTTALDDLADQILKSKSGYRIFADPRIVVTRGESAPSFEIYIDVKKRRKSPPETASFQFEGKAVPARRLEKIDTKASAQFNQQPSEAYVLELSEAEFASFAQNDIGLRVYSHDGHYDFDIPTVRFQNLWDDYQTWKSKNPDKAPEKTPAPAANKKKTQRR